MGRIYKHFLSLTSQIPFCACPIRMDSVKDCAYGCGYCFSMTRQGYGRKAGKQIADAERLERRLVRAEQGEARSALDEFIRRRVPIQFGGMSDPFSPSELANRSSEALMTVLAKYKYPYMVSTKGTIVADSPYIELLGASNAYVRVSTTIVDPVLRGGVDKRTPDPDSILAAVARVAQYGIPVCLRFQPIFPGHEDWAFRWLDEAKRAGVNHISAEYLKVPIDARKKFSSEVIEALGGDPIEAYISYGAELIGREWILPRRYREMRLGAIADAARARGITFGYGDNDLLVHSDGGACCSAADLYLDKKGLFRANVVGVAQKVPIGEDITMNHVLGEWWPEHRVSPYLNSRSRIESGRNDVADWPEYVRRLWDGDDRAYSPGYFSGIVKAEKYDDSGFQVYRRVS